MSDITVNFDKTSQGEECHDLAPSPNGVQESGKVEDLINHSEVFSRNPDGGRLQFYLGTLET